MSNNKSSEILKKVAARCAIKLQEYPEAVDYLRNREISEQSIKEFEIGYFPSRELSLFKALDKQALRDLRLLSSNSKYSPLEGRITFPFYDQYGSCIAITGRPPLSDAVGKQKGFARKYWHNAFNKRKYLYNLHKAIPYIRKSGKVYVVEGQFDVITAWQHGFKNVIASSGTALTKEHIMIIARYADSVIGIFDSDIAGKKAAEKLELHEAFGLELKTIELNFIDKMDVDTFIRNKGKKEFQKLILHSHKGDNSLDQLLIEENK